MSYAGKRANKAGLYENYRTFDEFVKNVKIPERYWQFFQNFINEKSDTFGNATKSYIAAGYASNSTTRYRARALYNSVLMQRLINLYHQKTAEKRENRDISVFDRTDSDLLWALERAKQCGDHSAVRAIAMDRAKLHGILVDKHQVIDPATEQAIDRTKSIEAAQLAESRLLGESPGTPENVIDAVFEPSLSDDCPTELYNDDIESAILNQN